MSRQRRSGRTIGSHRRATHALRSHRTMIQRKVCSVTHTKSSTGRSSAHSSNRRQRANMIFISSIVDIITIIEASRRWRVCRVTAAAAVAATLTRVVVFTRNFSRPLTLRSMRKTSERQRRPRRARWMITFVQNVGRNIRQVSEMSLFIRTLELLVWENVKIPRVFPHMTMIWAMTPSLTLILRFKSRQTPTNTSKPARQESAPLSHLW